MSQPMIRIDLDAPTPAYQQIVDSLRTLLVEGALSAGDRLPPVRQLATDLGVHFNTVAQAYRHLADEGWLELRRRRGAQVIERSPSRRPASSPESFQRTLRQQIAKARTEGLPPATIAAILEQAALELKENKDV